MSAPPDVVIPVKVDEHNEELRYVLRSLSNLPHRRVHIFGFAPRWVNRDTVNVVERRHQANKFEIVLGHVRAACMSTAVSDDFVLFNDDMYVMRPIDEIPVLNAGPVPDVVAYYRARGNNSTWVRSMESTNTRLEQLGYRDVLSFENHTPLPVNSRAMLAAIGLRNCHRWNDRTAYGAVAGLVGDYSPDVKIYTPTDPIPDSPLLSTADVALDGPVLERFQTTFPDPCRYER